MLSEGLREEDDKNKTVSQTVALFRENAGSGVFELFVGCWARTDSSLVVCVCGVVMGCSAWNKLFGVVMIQMRWRAPNAVLEMLAWPA
jgi:hypothetical protein